MSDSNRHGSRFTDEFLDQMRLSGDELADEVIHRVDEEDQTDAVRKLMATLIENDDPIPEALPAVVREYLKKTEALYLDDLTRIEKGEQVFASYGPEIIMLLGLYSLPAAYAAANGVKVLYETAYLREQPNQRLLETVQMVIDVMQPGGFAPRGRGVRSAQKVRLMHATIRYLILKDPHLAWDVDSLGVPINQEDLAGTLMTFSWVVLDGLQKLGVVLGADQQEAYLETWRAVGRIMGLNHDLEPTSVAEADELAHVIQRRQIRGSREGVEMTAALLALMKKKSPKLLSLFPASLMRYLIPRPVPNLIGVPRHPLTLLFVNCTAWMVGAITRVFNSTKRRRRLFRAFSMSQIQWVTDAETHGKRAKFAIPEQLHDDWESKLGLLRRPMVRYVGLRRST